MIDYVSMYIQIYIPRRNFSPMTWSLVKRDTGNFYYKKIRTAKLRYFVETQRFLVTGKLINLFYDTQVLNVDDLYGRDTHRFINEVNEYLFKITGIQMDILNFTVSRIDYCFNVETQFVQAYLDLLNRAYKTIDTRQRRNFSIEHKTPGSVYIKTASDYRRKTRTNYTLNFYDKTDWIANQRKRGCQISKEDDAFAKDILRLEVQASYALLDAISKKHHIERTFCNFFTYDIAFEAICTVYGRVFHSNKLHDFYTYQTAKQLIRNPKARHVLELAAEHHPINTPAYRYAVNLIKTKGIFPYAFLPAGFDVDCMPNPLALIEDKISTLIV